MLKKIKDWIGSNLDVYRVTNASDVGAGLVRHEWQGENFATQIGTTLNAQIMNDMQKGLVHNLNSTLVQNIRESIYQTTLDGLDEFEIFDGLKIRLTVDAPNANAGAKLRLNNVDYTILKEKNGQLEQIEVGDFKANKTYDLTYNGSQFIVINLINTATETEAGIVTLNQIKGLVPTIPEASESQAGVVTLAKIKEISPKADLSNYVTFNKGYRVTDNTNWMIRSSLSETWMPHQALMFNENGNYTGTFHLNGSRAYYKAPNRNGGNWIEIMDNFDRDNLQSQINAHLNGYQFSKTGSGYCKFPNGFIIQWGWGTTNTPTNFPIAFPNACLRIIGTQNGYSEIYENIKIMDGWTNYNFRMKLLGDQTFYFHYIAIGY